MPKTARKKKKKITPDQLRRKLKLKHFKTLKSLNKKYPKVDKFFKKRGLDPGKIRQHSATIVGAGALASTLLLAPVTGLDDLPTPQEIITKLKGDEVKLESLQKTLADSIKSFLPVTPRELTRNEEKLLEQIFQSMIGITAKATLEGEHLNTTYGNIGTEQHLRRFPGDTLLQHGSGDEIAEGLTPGLGAWGYFANSKKDLDESLVETEKWYAVVQTLYLPDWGTRQPFLKDWYKYRKVLIVNTSNGNAVVASVADSGPAVWTGKHYGGSPEVMHALGGAKYKKGPVIVFFVDDPQNDIVLGPVEYGTIKLPK